MSSKRKPTVIQANLNQPITIKTVDGGTLIITVRLDQRQDYFPKNLDVVCPVSS